jgi:hypothetical protein
MKTIVASLLILSIVAFTFAPVQSAEANCWVKLTKCLASAASAYNNCIQNFDALGCLASLASTVNSCYKFYDDCLSS